MNVLVSLLLAAAAAQEQPLLSDLLQRFASTTVFWQQFEVAEAIAARQDASVLERLEPWLTHEDRHLRGNAAFVFGKLGDPRGFAIIKAILHDRSERPRGQGIAGGRWSVRAQIAADRYYAAHLLGDLGDARGVPVLAPLLTDPEVRMIVPWALGRIGSRSAFPALLRTLDDPDPSMRVLAIHALVELKAREAVPRLQALVDDTARANFGRFEIVAEAARSAIVRLAEGPTR